MELRSLSWVDDVKLGLLDQQEHVIGRHYIQHPNAHMRSAQRLSCATRIADHFWEVQNLLVLDEQFEKTQVSVIRPSASSGKVIGRLNVVSSIPSSLHSKR